MATAPRILTDTGWVRPSLGPLITLLVDGGVLDQADGFSAETIAQRQDLRTADVLISKFEVAHFTIAQAYSTLYQARFVNPGELPLPMRHFLTPMVPPTQSGQAFYHGV